MSAVFRAVLAGVAALLVAAAGAEPLPLADLHLHYKATQREATTPAQALQALRGHGVVLGVVVGTPPGLALELVRAARRPGGPRLVAFYGPYREPGDWSRWTRDRALPARVRAALASGDYHGVGELHFIGGFAPRWDTPVIRGVLEAAAEFGVPALVHTEFSRADYMLGLCRGHPDLILLWAHAGAILPPVEVERVMAACPNVWLELSARDPWRYVNHPITGDDGRLLPDWRALVLRHAERVVIGSDPVWPVERMDGWDEPDTGWRELGRFLAFHRRWLDDLPPETARAIGLDNARRLFGAADAASP